MRPRARLARLLARLSCNRIEVVPEGLFKLTQLRKLDLEDNGIRTLPDALGALRSLEALFLVAIFGQKKEFAGPMAQWRVKISGLGLLFN